MTSLKKNIKKEHLPSHVAIIMDGNGRWANERGEDRVFGHANGVESVRNVVEAAGELGINYLTLYAFSMENWSRPQDEVFSLMNLLVHTIKNETDRLDRNNVRLQVIGDIERLPETVKASLEYCLKKTGNNTGLTLVLALSYSARWEIMEASKKLALDIEKKNIKIDQVNEDLFSSYLVTNEIPDPDLLIRTSGEMRISNFLLWQLAYTELYFTETMWPEFTKEDFFKAMVEYQKRERRFGLTNEQISK